MKVKVYNIKWDTDGYSIKKLGLPKSIEMDVDEESLDDPYYEDISDELSDEFGYCVFGFNVKPL